MVDLATHPVPPRSGGTEAAPSRFTPDIRAIDTGRPWVWLNAAWRDIAAAPAISFTYGVLAVVSSVLLVFGLAANDLHYLILPLAAGFMLVGPVLAVGLYEASRQLESGGRPTLISVLSAYHRNGTQIAAIGLVLMLALLAWIRVAFLVFAIFFGSEPPALDMLVSRIFFSVETIPFLLTGTAIGAVIATAVFALSVVSLPMLLDRDTDVFTAIVTSIAAVRKNWRAMAVWAALIALFTAAGIATGFIGLALAFPLIGHASWHCYRDVVGRS
ncbi:DUF2189 domain-containing protein [Azospirillum halopraeferens]|uniref:DUF2189 domain-containing protein n=1 Tax=Azospirillum halopraeferens TaxID=34010 RepID=UPI000406C8F6|nr:DUF2189 domain-containing protein [Azospirillum halopraeferens]